ncbi:MAG: hypothetical protein ACXWX9_11705 [Actinomycetota bacterium]
MAGRTPRIDVCLEVGAKRTFASALAWPGWTRGGRDVDAALDALAAYGPRYARALSGSRLGFRAPADAVAFRVVERMKGDATTDFGAPGAAPEADTSAVGDADLRRLRSVLRASWRALDAAAEAAGGTSLRTGPRGGGRPLGKILEHVLGADEGYQRSLGATLERGASGDLERVRAAILEAVEASACGEFPERGPRGGLRWSPRYYARRAAWHTLDHAWEIEDRSS